MVKRLKIYKKAGGYVVKEPTAEGYLAGPFPTREAAKLEVAFLKLADAAR